jgi:acyl-CoA thioesterase-1
MMKKLTLTLLLLATLSLVGCGSSTSSNTSTTEGNTSSATADATDAQSSIRVACVGDSITEGVGTSSPSSDSYPAQLSTRLGDGWEVGNFGKSGATLIETGDFPYSDTAQFVSSQDFNPNIVVIMLGTNDMKPANVVEIDRFISDYTALINSYKALPSSPKVYVAFPPPSYGDIAGITDNKITNLLLPKIQIVSQANNVPIINIYNALQNKSSLFPDTLHPNNEGARIIATTVERAIN